MLCIDLSSNGVAAWCVARSREAEIHAAPRSNRRWLLPPSSLRDSRSIKSSRSTKNRMDRDGRQMSDRWCVKLPDGVVQFLVDVGT